MTGELRIGSQGEIKSADQTDSGPAAGEHRDGRSGNFKGSVLAVTVPAIEQIRLKRKVVTPANEIIQTVGRQLLLSSSVIVADGFYLKIILILPRYLIQY